MNLLSSNVAFILTRAIHVGACLLFFGVFAFDRVAAPCLRRVPAAFLAQYWERWLRRFSAVMLPLILASGLAWFGLVAKRMSGLPWPQALGAEVLRTVWQRTAFGAVSQWRLGFALAACVTAAPAWRTELRRFWRPVIAWLLVVWSALLLGSLAWMGHGVEGNPAWGHATADVVHLLTAGFWPAGLLPLAVLLNQARQGTEAGSWLALAALVRRFSLCSFLAVTALAGSGWINGWFLVGSFSRLATSSYGRWLILKVVLFGIALGIGAVNLTLLRPRLSSGNPAVHKPETAAARLQRNVQWELLLAVAITVIVAILGTLPPAAR